MTVIYFRMVYIRCIVYDLQVFKEGIKLAKGGNYELLIDSYKTNLNNSYFLFKIIVCLLLINFILYLIDYVSLDGKRMIIDSY